MLSSAVEMVKEGRVVVRDGALIVGELGGKSTYVARELQNPCLGCMHYWLVGQM